MSKKTLGFVAAFIFIGGIMFFSDKPEIMSYDGEHIHIFDSEINLKSDN